MTTLRCEGQVYEASFHEYSDVTEVIFQKSKNKGFLYVSYIRRKIELMFKLCMQPWCEKIKEKI